MFLENFAVVRIDELSAGRDVARYHINAVSTLLQTDIGMTSLCIACALFWLNPECWFKFRIILVYVYLYWMVLPDRLAILVWTTSIVTLQFWWQNMFLCQVTWIWVTVHFVVSVDIFLPLPKFCLEFMVLFYRHLTRSDWVIKLLIFLGSMWLWSDFCWIKHFWQPFSTSRQSPRAWTWLSRIFESFVISCWLGTSSLHSGFLTSNSLELSKVFFIVPIISSSGSCFPSRAEISALRPFVATPLHSDILSTIW